MYTNEHLAKLTTLKRELEAFHSSVKEQREKLRLHNAFDLEQAHAIHEAKKREYADAQQELTQVQTGLSLAKKKRDEFAAESELTFNPMQWFSSERRVAGIGKEAFALRVSALEDAQKTLVTELNFLQLQIGRQSQEIERFRQFEPLEAMAVIDQCQVSIGYLEELIVDVSNAANRWEASAGALARSFHELRQELAVLTVATSAAEEIQQALDRAGSDAYAKRKIHDKCEARFGYGQRTPGTALKRLRPLQDRAARDLAKVEARLQDVLRLMSQIVEAIVIDGSNLCYAPGPQGQHRFIGTVALEALVAELSTQHTVSIIFDPGIVRQAAVDHVKLQARFPNATVTVVPDKMKADEAILGAAEFDEKAFIISNDKFKDYPDSAAVIDGRIFDHFIHAKSIQIQRLQLNIPY